MEGPASVRDVDLHARWTEQRLRHGSDARVVDPDRPGQGCFEVLELHELREHAALQTLVETREERVGGALVPLRRSDLELQALDRAIDQKLTICRGC